LGILGEERISQTVVHLKEGEIVSFASKLPGKAIIDLLQVNFLKDINVHFDAVNNALPIGGIYFGRVETYAERKQRLFDKFPALLVHVFWFFDFWIHRVMPKLAFTRKLYKFISRDNYKSLSKAEVLGRLCYTGFDIVDYATIDNLFYFAVQKAKPAKYDAAKLYGVLLRMNRIGQHKKRIIIYKIRTMHPYSEYLQHYVVKMHGYNEKGKPNNDFRLTSWGKVIRKFHLDELPQLYNLLRGDLAIIGVRPLTEFGFNALPKDLRRKRTKVKPGCIPPNVALKLTGFEGVVEAERTYLKSIAKHRFLTNFKYFWMAIYNLIRRKSSSA